MIWYDSGQILCFSNIEVAYHFKKASDVRICSMAKNKNLKMLDATNLLSKHHFGFNNQKSHLEAITVNAHGYLYSLLQKAKTQKCPKSTESFLNKNHSLLTVTITRKLLKPFQFGI